MRKIALVLIVGLLSTGMAFAHHTDDEVGIGAVFNFGGGRGGGFFNPGLSLKLPGVPVFWGFFFHPVGDFGLGLTGDIHFFTGNLITDVLADDEGYTYNLRIDWFAGLGGFTNVFFGGNATAFSFGVRMPGGVSWHIVRWAELALSIVPSFGMYAIQGSSTGFHWSIGGELALRYWFTPQARRGNGNRERGHGNRTAELSINIESSHNVEIGT